MFWVNIILLNLSRKLRFLSWPVRDLSTLKLWTQNNTQLITQERGVNTCALTAMLTYFFPKKIGEICVKSTILTVIPIALWCRISGYLCLWFFYWSVAYGIDGKGNDVASRSETDKLDINLHAHNRSKAHCVGVYVIQSLVIILFPKTNHTVIQKLG